MYTNYNKTRVDMNWKLFLQHCYLMFVGFFNYNEKFFIQVFYEQDHKIHIWDVWDANMIKDNVYMMAMIEFRRHRFEGHFAVIVFTI